VRTVKRSSQQHIIQVRQSRESAFVLAQSILVQVSLAGILMPSRLLVETSPVRKLVGAHPDVGGSVPEISELNSLAVQSLLSLFDERQKLFCRRIELTAQGFRREGTSRRSTMIALLGLQRLVESGATLALDTVAIQDAILGDASWVGTAGDLGLLTWFTAICAPERLPALLDNFDFEKVLDACVDAREGHTRGLAWFLAGIAHARRASPRTLPSLTDVAVEAYHLLLDNQSEQGLFGRMGSRGSLCEILSTRFGTFADQMYAIYALTAFAREFEIEEPLESALNCANSVCALQGHRGQWWFRYDTRRGCVANQYPVYSAHQDGTGPTALLALEEATSQSFHVAIWNGLSWIVGNNELGVDLRSLDHALIWDSIESQTRITRHWETACSYLHLSRAPLVKSLRIRYEARPDHFGWLLYAFGKFGLPKKAISTATVKMY
jgi:hypothetical protein